MRPALCVPLLALTALCGCKPKPAPATVTAAAPAATAYSWWVTATFDPQGETVEGLPIRTIDTSWAGALALSRSVLPSVAANDLSGLADSTITFTRDGDFNHDGVRDRALVGVYRTHAGTTGRFLLILTQRSGRPTIAHLSQEPGQAGFSGLAIAHDTLSWVECMECDVSWEFAWNGHEYALLPSAEEHE